MATLELASAKGVRTRTYGQPMQSPGHRFRSLGELTVAELEAMLREDETLFVEHKSGFGGEGKQIAKATASFANTMGGWVLVGITDGRPNEGREAGWTPPERTALVDAVRTQLEGLVDPLPSFAARIMQIDEQRVGVIRVYESADTPHVFEGAIYVRQPAQDKNLRAPGRHVAAPVATHQELLALAQRGRAARAEAERRFEEGQLPACEALLGLQYTTAASTGVSFRTLHTASPLIALRLAPLTLDRRFQESATSQVGFDACQRVARSLVPDPVRDRALPFATGLGVTAQSAAEQELGHAGITKYTVSASALLDGGGAAGVQLAYSKHDADSRDFDRFEFNPSDVREAFILPPLIAAARLLASCELFGRYVCQMHFLRMTEMIITNSSTGEMPAVVPLGGELTIPALEDEASDKPSRELDGLADRWAYQLGRSCGLAIWAK